MLRMMYKCYRVLAMVCGGASLYLLGGCVSGPQFQQFVFDEVASYIGLIVTNLANG